MTSHILIIGTPSSGKSTLCKEFQKHGYTHISIDHFIDKCPPTLDIDKYYDDDEYFLQFYSYPMFNSAQTSTNTNIIFDDITPHLIDIYNKKDKDLFSVVLYTSLPTLIEHFYTRRTTEYRTWSQFSHFTTLYKMTESETDYIDIIYKDQLRDLLKQKLKFLFYSEEDLYKKVDEFFSDLGCSEDTTCCKITLCNDIKPNLIIKTLDQTPVQLMTQINNYINRNHILLVGPSGSGKTYIGNHFEKLNYTILDHMGKQISGALDTDSYYPKEKRYIELFAKGMVQQGILLDRVLYQDITIDIKDLYRESNRILFTVFLHSSLETILKRLNGCRIEEFRSYINGFTDLYELAKDYEKSIMTIQYNEFVSLLETHVKYWFKDYDDLKETAEGIFDDLNIKEIESEVHYRLKIKDVSKYDLVINTEEEEDIVDLILH
jgi:adenylate kinase family enzyme